MYMKSLFKCYFQRIQWQKAGISSINSDSNSHTAVSPCKCVSFGKHSAVIMAEKESAEFV